MLIRHSTGTDEDIAIRLPGEIAILNDDELNIEDGSLYMSRYDH
jgi:hypothetical protein